MAFEITQYAQVVFAEISRLKMLLMCVIGDNKAFNRKLADAHEVRKAEALGHLRELLKNRVGPEDHIESLISYSGESGSEQNAPYTDYLESAFGEMALCRAVDFYHVYLRQVVLLAATATPTLLRSWKSALNISEKRLQEFESGANPAGTVAGFFRGNESKIRALVYEHLNMPLREDLEVLVEVRNCIVHQGGKDADGALATILAGNDRLGICVVKGSVVVRGAEAQNLVDCVFSDLSILDQCLARTLQLPTAPFVHTSFRRVYS